MKEPWCAMKKTSSLSFAAAMILSLSTLSCAGSARESGAISVEDVTSYEHRPRDSSELELNLFVDYSGVTTSMNGFTFFRDWREGKWAAHLRLHRTLELEEIVRKLDGAPVISTLRTDREKAKFLGGVQVVITTNRSSSDIFYVSACRFLKEGSSSVRPLPSELTKYYEVFELEFGPRCSAENGAVQSVPESR